VPDSSVIGFSKKTATMTIADALAFIERTRRQVDRFNVLPRAPDQWITPEDAADIHRQCDELEADLKRRMGLPFP